MRGRRGERGISLPGLRKHIHYEEKKGKKKLAGNSERLTGRGGTSESLYEGEPYEIKRKHKGKEEKIEFLEEFSVPDTERREV